MKVLVVSSSILKSFQVEGRAQQFPASQAENNRQGDSALQLTCAMALQTTSGGMFDGIIFYVDDSVAAGTRPSVSSSLYDYGIALRPLFRLTTLLRLLLARTGYGPSRCCAMSASATSCHLLC